MAKLVSTTTKVAIAPPTKQQLADLKLNLGRMLFVEHAAALAGIPRRVLRYWIENGRAGHPDFVEFVELLDNQLAELSDALLTPIVAAAADGNLAASQWLYQQRVKPFEDHAIKRQLKREDEIEEASRMVEANVAASEGDDLAAKLLEQMTAATTPEKH